MMHGDDSGEEVFRILPSFISIYNSFEQCKVVASPSRDRLSGGYEESINVHRSLSEVRYRVA